MITCFQNQNFVADAGNCGYPACLGWVCRCAGVDAKWTLVQYTGKEPEMPYCMVMKFKDGLVSELYEYDDQL
jgi:hypothetical protein